MNVPLVTIITVCYNAEYNIKRTLQSVRNQNYTAIEYLVIDGASLDGTLALVKSITPFARVFSEPDKGIYDAMNKGLALAQGVYVWFLNAGDALPSATTVAEIFVPLSQQSPDAFPDVIYGDCLLIGQDGQIMAPRRLSPPEALSWKSFMSGMLVCHQSFIAKRSLCPQYDTKYLFSADVDWCIRVMKRSTQYYQVKHPISHYLIEGATTRNHTQSLIERFKIMCHHYGLYLTCWQHLKFFFRALKP